MIPREHCKLEITGLKKTFYKNTEVSSLEIPSSVRYISDLFTDDENTKRYKESIFFFCRIGVYAIGSIVTFIIFHNVVISAVYFSPPKIVTAIASGAFRRDDYTKNENLETVIMPNSVVKLGRETFDDCIALRMVRLSSKLHTIPYFAFCGCTSLASINIPIGIKKIKPYAFMKCISLTTVDIPNHVQYLGEYSFSECYKLSSVIVPKVMNKWGAGVFRNCRSLISIEIPDGVKYIREEMFSGCTSLLKVTIGENISHIARNAFYNCSNLTIHTPLGSYAAQYAKKNNISHKTYTTEEWKKLRNDQ